MSGEGGLTPSDSVEALSPYQSFANEIGFALGDLLLLSGRTEELAACIQCIQTTAYASILSADLGAQRERSQARTNLPEVALAVVRAWHEETEDLNAVGEAIAKLQDELEAGGVWYVAPGSDEE